MIFMLLVPLCRPHHEAAHTPAELPAAGSSRWQPRRPVDNSFGLLAFKNELECIAQCSCPCFLVFPICEGKCLGSDRFL